MAASDILENQTPEQKAQSRPESSATWLAEIDAAEKNQRKWREGARKIVKRFLDRREAHQESQNKLNLFTSNTGILISTLYARFPKPMVTREYEDPNDDVGRVAAEILQRCLTIRPRDDMDSAMRSAVQDRLVPGLATVWARYEPTIEKRQLEAVFQSDPLTGEQIEIQAAQEYEEVVDEAAPIDYVFWEDFLWSPTRTWDQVRWVGRAVKMSRADVEARFGPVIAAQLSYTRGSKIYEEGGETPDEDQVQYACIYEIWCRRTKHVYWVCKGFELILDKKQDPLRLEGFFPCPKPLTALHSTSNFMPRPDYLLVQDQYEELDLVNDRITKLERAIKAIGVYDGSNAEIERIFSEGMDNKIIPSRSFSEFMEKGGFKGAMDWLPIEMFTNALDKLRTYRQDLIQQIYELTGISDIMRGATRASETATAQQLKAQYGSVKLQFLQMEVAAFVEEVLEIKAGIVRNFFQPETIARISNAQFMYDQELVQQAIALIKSPEYTYRVEVHADSMAVPEFNAERDGRMAFMRAIAEMMTAAAPILEQAPGAGAGMLEIIKWGAASFRSGNTIEGVLDKAIAAIQQQAATPQPPAPPPPDIVAKAKKDESQAALNMAKTQETQVNTMLALTEPPTQEDQPPRFQ